MAPFERTTSEVLPLFKEDKPLLNERRQRENTTTSGATDPVTRTPLSDLMNSLVSSRHSESTKNPTGTKAPKAKQLDSTRQEQRKPYRADYETSKKSQKRIQAAAACWKADDGRPLTALDRASAVLETFLNLSPYKCNAANVVCALTLSAKTIGSETDDHFRNLLFRTNDALFLKLQDHSLSPRQLCNSVWALAKHYDRDEYILPIQPHLTSLSTETIYGTAEVWDLRDDVAGYPAQKVDATIDEIAKQLTAILTEDVYAAKEGELCMACWAFGVLRRRRRPPGWQNTPQISKLPVETPHKQQLASSNFIKFEQWTLNSVGDDEILKNSGVDSEAETVTGKFLDIVGRALSAPITSKSNGMNRTVTVQSERIRQCTWSELANVAWAFAAHGRACSDDAEHLLNKIGQEATSRLVSPTSQMETNTALSRDIAQIIWSLGVLQADNFRLGDVLVDFVSAVASTARSEGLIDFRNWSCPDIGQVVLALAHARIDDAFLVDSLFTEACRRFKMEGLSGAYRWKAWETSILLWAQARLYLTESRGSVYTEFPSRAIFDIKSSLHHEKSFQKIGIGPQEQANIAWSLTGTLLLLDKCSHEILESAATSQIDSVLKFDPFSFQYELNLACDSSGFIQKSGCS